MLADDSALALGNPRLKVEVHPEVYEGNAVWERDPLSWYGSASAGRRDFAGYFDGKESSSATLDFQFLINA